MISASAALCKVRFQEGKDEGHILSLTVVLPSTGQSHCCIASAHTCFLVAQMYADTRAR